MSKPLSFGATSWAGLIFLLCLQNASASDRLLDVDADDSITPLTDGLMVIRYLFGFTGSALTQDALALDANRTDASEIEIYLDSQEAALDIDSDGQALPLTDGLLIIRSQFGFTENALTNDAVESSGQRSQAIDISSYIESLEQPGSANPHGGNGSGGGTGSGSGSGSGSGGAGSGSGSGNGSGSGSGGGTGSGSGSGNGSGSGSGGGTGSGSGSGNGSGSGPGGGTGSGSGSGASGLLPDIDTDFNVHAIAVTDHIDSRSKPVFYGLNPKVNNNLLTLALNGQNIDRSNIKALLDANSDQGISLKILMLLDRVPAAGSGGELSVIFRLIDGDNEERTPGEREIYTRATLLWSSDGSELAIEVPIQDQPLTGWTGGGTEVQVDVSDTQPNILTARLTPEYPGYPLALEIKALELFDERLLDSFFFKDIIPTYFDSVKDYFLVIGLEQTGSAQEFPFGFQGQSFSSIHATLTIDEVIHQEAPGFDLTSTDETTAGLQPGYLAKLINLGANADETLGLFAALEGNQLVFEQPPAGTLDKTLLNNELFKTTASVSSPAIKLRLNQIPLSDEALDVTITFTDGQDAMRSDSERQLSISFSSQFDISDGQGVISTQSNATTLTLEDDNNCADSSLCRIDNLTTSSGMFQIISDSSTESSATLPRLQLSLLPLLGLSSESSLPLTDFFTEGPYHLQVNISGTSGPLTYEGLAVDGLGGVVSIE